MGSLRYTKLAFFCIFLSNISLSQEGKVIDNIVAIVGKNIVLRSDIQKSILQLEAQGENISNIPNFKCFVFERLLFEVLLETETVKDTTIIVSNEEIESHVEQRIETIKNQLGSIEKMEEFYGLKEDDIRLQAFETIKMQLIAQKVQQKIISKIDVTPSEVKSYFDNIDKDKIVDIDEEYEIAQLIIHPKLSESSKEVVINKLNQIRDEILEGANFRTKAVLYSEDPGSSSKGGEYKGVKRGTFVKEFESVAFNLEEGEISKPVETEFGFHIIQLIKKRGDELDLRHILIVPRYNEEEIEEARKKIDSIRTLVKLDSISFQNAVRIFSDDDNTKFNEGLLVNYSKGSSKLALEDINPEMYQVIKDLKPGDISEVILEHNRLGKEEFKFFLLKNKIDPHKLNYEQDYEKIKKMALSQKEDIATNKWKKEKIKNTYIKIIEDKENCEFISEWEKSRK